MTRFLLQGTRRHRQATNASSARRLETRPRFRGAACALLMGCFSLLAAVASTTEAFSTTFAALAKPLNPAQGNTPGMTWFASQTVRPALNQGVVTQLIAMGFTAGDTEWHSDQMNLEAGPMYVEFNSGWMADIVSIDDETQFVEVSGELSSMVTEGEAYRIRRHTTVNSLLSQTQGAHFMAGFDDRSADCLLFGSPWGGYEQSLLIQDEAGSPSEWVGGSEMAIYPEQGLILRRLGSGAMTLFEVGELKRETSIVPVNAGLNLLGTLQTTDDLTLDALGLFTGDPTTGLASGPDASRADTLLVRDAGGHFREYFFSDFPDPEFQGWRSAAYESADAVGIHPGDAFYLKRKLPQGFDWILPATVSPF